MNRPIAILGAASSIGIKPYDNGSARQLDRSPAALRKLGLAQRLGAIDLGDVTAPAYRDYVRPPGCPRNEKEIVAYSRSLAQRVAEIIGTGRFALVLGGECSIVLANLLGARQRGGEIGLVYIDAHADFATPEESITGSVASMCLALAVGRGDTPLARLDPAGPLVNARNVALLGRRDAGESWYGHAALAASPILDLTDPAIREKSFADAATAALERVAATSIEGFWIHLDADVLDPAVMPAVDSPVSGGPSFDELAELVGPLVRHPKALGLEVTIYDPALDADGSGAARLVGFLKEILA